jgi:hypothetical protein
MYQFPVALQLGEDPSSGDVVLGFVHDDMFVFDPHSSSCGRFQVDPTETYGIPAETAENLAALNRLLHTTAENTALLALTGACTAVQLGVDLPDRAMELPAVGPAARQAIARVIGTEMLAQLGQHPAGAALNQAETA